MTPCFSFLLCTMGIVMAAFSPLWWTGHARAHMRNSAKCLMQTKGWISVNCCHYWSWYTRGEKHRRRPRARSGKNLNSLLDHGAWATHVTCPVKKGYRRGVGLTEESLGSRWNLKLWEKLVLHLRVRSGEDSRNTKIEGKGSLQRNREWDSRDLVRGLVGNSGKEFQGVLQHFSAQWDC